MYTTLLALLLLPLLACGQSTFSAAPNASQTPAPSGNSSAGPANTTVVFTSLSTGLSLGPGRVETTVVATFLITSIMPIQTSNATTTNNTAGNGTTAASSSTPPTTAANLPTAPANVDGGGQGGAPLPGAKSSNGAYGPDDNYIAAATALAKNALLVSIVGSLIGGVLVVV